MNYLKITLIFFFTIFSTALYSQKYNKEVLQKRNQQIRDEIKKLNEDLLRLKKESETSVLYFTQLNEKINNRNKLINNTSKEKRFIEDEIYLKQLEINKLNRELSELRIEYGQILVRSYKNKSVQNKMLFVLTSEDLGQAIRRLKYLEKYGDYQRNKSTEITKKQGDIVKSITQKEKSKKEKEVLLINQKKEYKVLDVEKQEKEKIILKYKQDENGLLTKLKEKQRVAISLERDIERAIREEIAIAKAKREAEAKKRKEEAEKKRKEAEILAKKEAEERKKREAEELAEAKRLEKIRLEKEKQNTKSTKPIEVTKPVEVVKSKPTEPQKTIVKETTKPIPIPEVEERDEMEIISDNFIANKKRLPMPVYGTVISRFGSHPHPVIPNITMNNAGIEIATQKGSISKAVFKGEVFKVQSIPGGNKAVMVNHGEYFTIYTNLEEVYVKVGDKVNIKENIGKVYTDDSGNTLAGFQIWRGTQKVDPANWLSGM